MDRGVRGIPLTKQRRVVRQSLPDVIAADLRKRILSGDLAEGELIRQELLADEYGVSRMPIREALKRLDAEGLVVFQNNRGATVVKHSLEEIAEIFDIRMLLEVDLFRRAIPQMTDAHFAACEATLADMERSYAAGEVAEWGPLNEHYHNQLLEAAGRTLTFELLQRASTQANRYVGMHIDQLNKSANAREDHRALLTLAKSGDVEAAAQRLCSHIDNTKRQVLALVASLRTGQVS